MARGSAHPARMLSLDFLFDVAAFCNSHVFF
jgi:hypothetical protein